MNSIIKFAGEIGQSAQIKCSVQAKPMAIIFWQKDGKNISNSFEYNIINRGGDSSLMIRNLKSSDYGDYLCVAFDRVGKREYMIKLSRPGMHNCF